MKAEMIKQVLEKYTGQKVRVVFITSTKAYWQEGILLGNLLYVGVPHDVISGIVIKVHEPTTEERTEPSGYKWTEGDSGIRTFNKNKVLQIITADGKVWETPAKEQWICGHCGYKTTRQPESKSGSFARCPKCGGMMQGRFERQPEEVKD